MTGCLKGWVVGWMKELMNGQVDRWKAQLINKQLTEEMTEQIKSFIHNLVLQQSHQVEECFPRLPPWTLGNVLMRERPISAYIAGSIVCQELTFQNQSDGIWPETLTTGAQGPILCCKGNRLT